MSLFKINIPRGNSFHRSSDTLCHQYPRKSLAIRKKVSFPVQVCRLKRCTYVLLMCQDENGGTLQIHILKHVSLFVVLISDPKQSARSLLTPISDPAFNALSHGTNHFTPYGRVINLHLIGGSSTESQLKGSLHRFCKL